MSYTQQIFFALLGLHLMPLIMLSPYALFDPLDNPMTREKYRQYYCFKYKVCSGRNMVCGFDELRMFLATFDNKCTMYHMNCRGKGLFKLVDLDDCKAQIKYQKEHNETWQYDHLDRSLILNQTDYTLLTRGINLFGGRRTRFNRTKSEGTSGNSGI